jgi:hypothetical protein
MKYENGLAWFKADTWKQRGMRKRYEKKRCLLYGGEEVFYILYFVF